MEKTLAQAAKLFADMQIRLPKEVIKAEKSSLNEARRMAVTLSSGGYTSEVLALMGHPYSRRNPRPPLGRPDIINVQTGLFRASWASKGPATSGNSGEFLSVLLNTSPYGYKMRGTPNMIARPIDKTIARRMEPRRLKRLQVATARALKVR